MVMNVPIRILCVDDHAFLVEGLKSQLSLHRDFEFVGRLPTAENLVSECRRLRPHIVLLDISMPGPDPFEAMEDLKRTCPDVKVIMLTAYTRDHYIDAAVNAGAWGYLSKNDDPSAIIQAIRQVSRGEFFFGPGVLERCRMGKRGSLTESNQPKSKLQLLSPREQQVLRMIGKGMGRAEIARSLCRSPKTVDAHRAAIMEKVDIHDRVELALFAVREGLVDME